MIEIQLDDSKLQRGLSQLLKNATHTASMMRGMAQELESLTKENFADEAWGGDKWDQSAAAAKENRKTLYASGELHDNITTEAGNGFARIGSNLKYAAIHHLGGNAGRGRKLTLPARHYLPINGSGKLQKDADQTLLNTALDALKSNL